MRVSVEGGVAVGGREAPYFFRDAVRSYLRRGKRGRTQQRVASFLEADFHGLKVGEITSAVIDEWVDERLREVSGPTVRRELAVLMSVLKGAFVGGRLAAMPTVVRPSDGEPRLRRLTDSEVYLLLHGEGREEERMLCRWLVNTGARMGEALAMTEADIVGGGEGVKLRSLKGTGKVRERIVPLNEEAKAVLAWMRAGRGKVGWRWTASSPASLALTRLADGVGVKDFTPHDLRRTFAFRLLEADVNVRVVAELLGHASLEMVMRYAVPSGGLLRSAVDRIG